jgi:hypothetical protein
MEIDSGVFSDWRVMDFRRRPGPDEPDAQVIEDGSYYLAVLNEADDPHGALALRTDQGIDFVMPEYIHPKNIQGPDKGDRHSFSIETLMTVPDTKEHENGYPGEYKEIEYLNAHFQVKGCMSFKIIGCSLSGRSPHPRT